MGVMFVTGAVKNTGLAIAEKFAAGGFDVAVSSRRQNDASQTARNLAEKYGVKAKGYGLDLTDVGDIIRVFDAIKSDFGRLDAFVANSAALGIGLDLLTATESDYDSLMNVNLKGTYFCCQRAALIMKEQGGGSVVIIGSIHCRGGVFGRSLYSVSKGGLYSLAKSMAVELGAYGIRTNCVLAGAIRTDRWNGITDEQAASRRANWPLGTESTGDDIANAVFYLGTDLSKTVSGASLTIDSGISACLLPFNGGKH